MEFAVRNFMFSHWFSSNLSLHYRNELIPKYFYSQHWLTLFFKRGQNTIVSSIVSDPK
jgi:hypothetical protein